MESRAIEERKGDAGRIVVMIPSCKPMYADGIVNTIRAEFTAHNHLFITVEEKDDYHPYFYQMLDEKVEEIRRRIYQSDGKIVVGLMLRRAHANTTAVEYTMRSLTCLGMPLDENEFPEPSSVEEVHDKNFLQMQVQRPEARKRNIKTETWYLAPEIVQEKLDSWK